MSESIKEVYDNDSYIMVVDDDQTLLKFFKIHLNKFFSRVVVVSNAKEAMDTLNTKPVDLVLSDIRMPRIDGLKLLKKIRKFDASIPVFLISGALLTEEQEELIDQLADGLIRKPFTIEQIEEFITVGIEKRNILKELSELVGDNKTLLSLIKGKSTVHKVKDPVKKKRINELLDHYRDPNLALHQGAS